LLNKSSFLAPTLGVTKFIRMPRIWTYFNVLLELDLDIQQTHLRDWFVEQNSCLAPTLGVAKFITFIALNLDIF
jgi:hypothetical protein